MKHFQNVKRSLALSATASTATAASSAIDLKDADYATIELVLGTGLNTNAAPVVVKIQESDTTAATAFVDINTNTLQKSIALSTAAGQVAAFHVNPNGTRKRFIRLFATPGTTATNSAVALTAIANVQMDQFPAGTVGQADVVAIG
jgi:hypothetical protein